MSTEAYADSYSHNAEGAMKEKIRRFLSEQFLIPFGAEVDENSNLFELGLLDSYGYVELIRFIESEFSLRFTEDDILSDVVVSLSGIVGLASAKVAELT